MGIVLQPLLGEATYSNVVLGHPLTYLTLEVLFPEPFSTSCEERPNVDSLKSLRIPTDLFRLCLERDCWYYVLSTCPQTPFEGSYSSNTRHGSHLGFRISRLMTWYETSPLARVFQGLHLPGSDQRKCRTEGRADQVI